MTRDPREIAQRIREYVVKYCGIGVAENSDPVEFILASHFALKEQVRALAAEMPRWVPVEEQPKKDGAYEVVDADGVRTIQWFDKDSDEWTNERDASYLTHWLDGVPSPPREEAK